MIEVRNPVHATRDGKRTLVGGELWECVGHVEDPGDKGDPGEPGIPYDPALDCPRTSDSEHKWLYYDYSSPKQRLCVYCGKIEVVDLLSKEAK